MGNCGIFGWKGAGHTGPALIKRTVWETLGPRSCRRPLVSQGGGVVRKSSSLRHLPLFFFFLPRSRGSTAAEEMDEREKEKTRRGGWGWWGGINTRTGPVGPGTDAYINDRYIISSRAAFDLLSERPLPFSSLPHLLLVICIHRTGGRGGELVNHLRVHR